MNKTGSTREFDENWKGREEALYNHWTKGSPKNQIQLAFRSHWKLFKELTKDISGNKCLEVGCGRGSISSYFADAGFDCTLLDYSQSVLDTAQKIFKRNNHKAQFVNGDANALPFEDESFDVVVSIGLLEHFEDIEKPIKEQYRILKKGGVFLGYIVPENPNNIQKYFRPVNALLKGVSSFMPAEKKKSAKVEIYRSDFGSDRYMQVISKLPHTDRLVRGVYPLPMISHSPEFPFSLLPTAVESALAVTFEKTLELRKVITKENPWLCDEKNGQAFLIAFRKI